MNAPKKFLARGSKTILFSLDGPLVLSVLSVCEREMAVLLRPLGYCLDTPLLSNKENYRIRNNGSRQLFWGKVPYRRKIQGQLSEVVELPHVNDPKDTSH